MPTTKRKSAAVDPEMVEFEAALLRSVDQVVRVHTPEQIAARGRGRPKLDAPKEAVKLHLDADVLAALRASGEGWQTRINDTLRASLQLAGRLAGPTNGSSSGRSWVFSTFIAFSKRSNASLAYCSSVPASTGIPRCALVKGAAPARRGSAC
ncbi:MAG: BrnA antitoxin family protein [Rubrivivax sp.]